MYTDDVKSLALLSELHAGRAPDQVCVVAGVRQWTWVEFHDAVLRTVAALRGSSIGAGDYVAFLGYNSDLYLVLLQACYRMGAVLVPLNWRLTRSEIGYLLGNCGARLLIMDPEFASSADYFRPHSESLSIVYTRPPDADGAGFDAWIADRPRDTAVIGASEAPCLLLYTSGTTGFPKGALLTHGSVLSSFRNATGTAERWAEWNEHTVALLATPIFHIGGSGWATQALIGGAKIVVLPRPDVPLMVDAIARHGVTKFFAVPAMLQMILNHEGADGADFSSVRALLYGASPISLDILRRSMSRFPNADFVQLYGATETSGNGTWLPAADHSVNGTPRMASCGKPYSGTAIKVIDGAGNALEIGQIGEICLQSPCLMSGYFNNPEATEAAIVDGWYRTGDAGYLDEDGYLYIQDRVKDMIVSGGENIYPAEVERVLHGHPAVRDCAIIGVPDSHWGEAAKAIVVLEPGMSLSEDELCEFLRGKVAGYKIPKSVAFAADLPRNLSGKVLKRELREPYWRHHERQVG